MPTRHARTQIAAAIVFAGVFLTAGCATGTHGADPATPASTVSAVVDPAQSPTPVETTPAAAPVVSGTVLTDAQVASLPDGVRAYTLPDGSKVAVVKGEPLPEVVQAAVTAKGKVIVPVPAGTGVLTSMEAQDAEITALKDAAKADGIALGRRIIYIVPVYTSKVADGPDGPKQHLWSTSLFDGVLYDSAEAAQAAQASLVAGNGSVVIVLG